LTLVSATLLAACAAGQLEAGINRLEARIADQGLRAEVSFTTSAGAEPVLTALSETGEGLRLRLPAMGPGEHMVPLLGLRPDTEYSIQVEAGARPALAALTTRPLPGDLPPIEVVSEPAAMAPGLTLFDAIPLGQESQATDDGYLLAVDPQGEVVWYYRQTHSIQEVRRTQDGQLVFIHHEIGVRKLNPVDGSLIEWSGTTGLDTAPEDEFGRAYAGAEAIRVDTEQMHHEVIELPDGNLMTLSREVRRIDGFDRPLCNDPETFDGSYEVAADTVVEFEPATGAVVSEVSLFDLVDPLSDLERIRPSEFCSQYLSDVYPNLTARDWTHGNGVVVDPQRNAVLVSVRHLDQIIAIR
jgi:hypothetical protein